MFRIMRTCAAHLMACTAFALMMSSAVSRLSAPPVSTHHAKGFAISLPEHCTSRPWQQEAEGCGQCAHFLTRNIVRDEDAWLLVIYANRGHVVSNRRRLRGRSRYAKSRHLPHQYFVGAMEEALEAIAEVEPGAKVNIAIFSEVHIGGMVDELGAPVSWDASHDFCDLAGLQCSKTEVMLDEFRSMKDAVRCMASADIFIGSDDEFSRDASRVSHNVRVVTPYGPLPEEDMFVLSVDSAIGGLSAAEHSDFRAVVRRWRECSQATRELMLLAGSDQ